MNDSGLRDLRLVLGVGAACGLTWAVCQSVGLASAAPYGVVMAAVLMRPDFQPWPRPLLVLLPVLLQLVVGLTHRLSLEISSGFSSHGGELSEAVSKGIFQGEIQ